MSIDTLLLFCIESDFDMVLVKTYTGVGSRKTPNHILSTMLQFATVMGSQGVLLRSGGANGADTAFETGCDVGKGAKQVFLPWKGFNKNCSELYHIMDQAYEIAASIHPAWDKCQQAARKLHARNCHQVLGPNLCDPSDVVVCWTPGGNVVGGTATAIKLAQKYNVPILNMAIPEDLAVIKRAIYRYTS